MNVKVGLIEEEGRITIYSVMFLVSLCAWSLASFVYMLAKIAFKIVIKKQTRQTHKDSKFNLVD